MTDIEDLLERVEDIIGDLLIVSDTLDKGVSSLDSMNDAIDDMKISENEAKELARFMIRFMLMLINDVKSKLDEIKKDVEDVNKELETMG
jgi:methyl-accepting chemotaxis protein